MAGCLVNLRELGDWDAPMVKGDRRQGKHQNFKRFDDMLAAMPRSSADATKVSAQRDVPRDSPKFCETCGSTGRIECRRPVVSQTPVAMVIVKKEAFLKMYNQSRTPKQGEQQQPRGSFTFSEIPLSRRLTGIEDCEDEIWSKSDELDEESGSEWEDPVALELALEAKLRDLCGAEPASVEIPTSAPRWSPKAEASMRRSSSSREVQAPVRRNNSLSQEARLAPASTPVPPTPAEFRARRAAEIKTKQRTIHEMAECAEELKAQCVAQAAALDETARRAESATTAPTPMPCAPAAPAVSAIAALGAAAAGFLLCAMIMRR